MPYSFNRNQRVYLAVETTFGTAATVTGSSNCLITKAVFKPAVDTLDSQSKTGTRTTFPGVGGRRHGTFQIDMELRGNGVAGVKPDCDVLLQAIFGKAGTISAGVSVTYGLDDAIVSFTAYNYRTPSTVAQQVAIGCIVQRATFKLGENIATCSMSGMALFVPDTFIFSSLDAPGKGGLGSIPAEPGSPTFNGPIIAGFTGVATIDTHVFANMRTADIDINLNSDIPLDVFGSYYGGTPEADARDVGITISTYDDDTAGTQDVYTVALTKALIVSSMQIGVVPGSIWTFTLSGLQLETPDITEGTRKWQANLARSRAHGTTLTAKDEVALVLT